ncbi:hypothetical protein C0584_00540 [Candidatus Parcubacteria bacterium]|nr:MAG: hypothetical protein C0584_00540 [Candidatus Parcubacteria bacterium]
METPLIGLLVLLGSLAVASFCFSLACGKSVIRIANRIGEGKGGNSFLYDLSFYAGIVLNILGATLALLTINLFFAFQIGDALFRMSYTPVLGIVSGLAISFIIGMRITADNN